MLNLQRQRLQSLDGLRGIAAAAVVCFHYEGLLSFDPSGANIYRNSQYTHLALLGVELFFMISGFVILMSAERAASTTTFLFGRAARMYPAYLVSIFPAALAALAIYGPSRPLFLETAANLTMLQRFAGFADLASPYWTLVYEVWFYAVIALLLACRLLSHLPALCMAWLIVCLPLHVLEHAGLIQFAGRLHILTFIDFGSFFICGMMSFLMLTGRSSLPVIVTLLSAILYNAVGRQDWAAISGPKYFCATLIFEGLIILAVRSRLRLLQSPALVWLGERSYSLYLLHVPVGLLFWAACHAVGLSAAVSVLFGVPASLLLAALSRRYIERPGQRFLKRMLGLDAARGRTVAAPPSDQDVFEPDFSTDPYDRPALDEGSSDQGIDGHRQDDARRTPRPDPEAPVRHRPSASRSAAPAYDAKPF